MEALIYFLLVAGVFVVAMRFGCGAHVLGHQRRGTGTAKSSASSTEERHASDHR